MTFQLDGKSCMFSCNPEFPEEEADVDEEFALSLEDALLLQVKVDMNKKQTRKEMDITFIGLSFFHIMGIHTSIRIAEQEVKRICFTLKSFFIFLGCF